MLDATREEPFEIDPDGTISWNATSTQPITNHTWVIYSDVGGSSSCSGEAYVLLRGNPLTELVGQVALAIAVLGALLVVRGGVAKSPR